MRIGIVESVKERHGFLRDTETWQRLFFSGADVGGDIPIEGTRVEYEADDDPRGPHARNVTPIAAPAPDIYIYCRDCQDRVTIAAGMQAWYAAKQYLLPTRCSQCREAKRERNAERQGYRFGQRG